jgi:transposase
LNKAEKKHSPEAAVQNIPRITRKKYSSKEKISILLDGIRVETTSAELCWKVGINQNLNYKWGKEILDSF